MHETTIKLIYLYGLTNKEIAEALGCSKSYVSRKMNPCDKTTFTERDHIRILSFLITHFKYRYFYFGHDYNALNDSKDRKLATKHKELS